MIESQLSSGSRLQKRVSGLLEPPWQIYAALLRIPRQKVGCRLATEQG